MTAPAAQALAAEGWNVWNVEYRRGASRWQETLADCAAAIDHVRRLADELQLPTEVVVVAGHSAGGQLAAWAAGRLAPAAHRMPVSGAVSLNGVLDLGGAGASGIGDDAVVEFLGGPLELQGDACRAADPVAGLPARVPVVCVHSRDDERVPFEMTEHYVACAKRAGGAVRLVEVSGHHTAPIEPGSGAWTSVVAAIETFAPAAMAQG